MYCMYILLSVLSPSEILSARLQVWIKFSLMWSVGAIRAGGQPKTACR